MIRDHIRFRPTFLGGHDASSYLWSLAAVTESDDGISVRKLTRDEFEQILQMPEVMPLGLVRRLSERVATLQATVDKRNDCQWDPGDDELRRAIGVAYTAFREGRKTQLEKDEAGDKPLDQEDPLAQLRNALGHTRELPELPDLIAEVKRLVRIEGERVRIATHLEFTNAHVIADALRLPKLVDALSHVATFESERAVRQALRNLDPEKRGAQHNDRALRDTMFTHSFEQVLEKWHERTGDAALSDALERGAKRGATAESLWQCLDDIDTLSDKIKPHNLAGYTDFYQRTLDIAKKRHLHLKSDGYVLTWPDGSAEPVATLVNKYADLVSCVESLAQGYSFESKFQEHQDHTKLLRELFNQAHEALQAPVPLLLHCPLCEARHIDEGEFATKKHHTHACQDCGHTWRPGIVSTVGVQYLPGFKNAAVIDANPNEVKPDVVVESGEGLVGEYVVVGSSGFEGVVDSYYHHDQTYLLRNHKAGSLRASRYEFTVLPDAVVGSRVRLKGADEQSETGKVRKVSGGFYLVSFGDSVAVRCLRRDEFTVLEEPAVKVTVVDSFWMAPKR